jgi:hypothetical protein
VLGSRGYQGSVTKYCHIPTIINGCIDSTKSEVRKTCISDGALNTQKVLSELTVNTQVKTLNKILVGNGNNTGMTNGKSITMKSDHKVVIYDDSHSRGLSARLKDKLPNSFEVIKV